MRTAQASRFGAIVLSGTLLWPFGALAYRPFDSTDPAVADLGEFEIELSPVGFRHRKGTEIWIAPSVRLNYGFARNWEIVLEGQAEHESFKRSVLVDNALSLKTILREGSLQDKSGISLASEASVLLPDVNGESGAGLSLAGIAGRRWDWGAVDVNLAGALTREGNGQVFFGTILEGPESWKIRPVAEFSYEREFGVGDEIALLAGMIWQASDKMAFDFGVRHALVNSRPETEVRMGLSFALSAL